MGLSNTAINENELRLKSKIIAESIESMTNFGGVDYVHFDGKEIRLRELYKMTITEVKEWFTK